MEASTTCSSPPARGFSIGPRKSGKQACPGLLQRGVMNGPNPRTSQGEAGIQWTWYSGNGIVGGKNSIRTSTALCNPSKSDELLDFLKRCRPARGRPLCRITGPGLALDPQAEPGQGAKREP